MEKLGYHYQPATMNLHTAQEQVIAVFDRIHPVSPALADSIREHSQLVHVAKKQSLLDIDKVAHAIYFILQGGIRTFYIDPEGNDITSWLLFEGELAISVYSFFGQQPSFEAMETLEDCMLLQLSHEKLNAMYSQHLEFNYIGRTLTELYYIRSEAKANALRMLSAKERYLDLLERQPQLIQRVPLGHIASYLGMTQSTLSRIRSRL